MSIGRQLDVQMQGECMAFMSAAKQGRPGCLRLLLKAGVDLEAKNNVRDLMC